MTEEAWVGIDLGTQSVRALAVTADGTVVGSGTAKLHSERDGSQHEQDPEQWWAAVGSACQEMLREVPRESIQAVAVDATSGTVLIVDAAGRPATPALMYDDTRAGAYVDEVNEVGAAVWADLGYQRMQPAWALPKLMWLVANTPALPSGARLAHQSDVINERLVGRPVATDLSNALKTGADLVAGDWPREVMDQLGLPADLFPPLVPPGAQLGTVGAGAAEHTGLPAGIPVIAGTTDGCAAQLGAGALAEGSWNSVVGTTLVFKGVSSTLIRDPLGVVYSHRGPSGEWLPGGASSTGAGAISRDFPNRDLDELNDLASAYEPANPLTYPLVSHGERFPFVAPQARGFSLGAAADDGDAFAAILQGVAYVERLCFDYLDLLGAPTDGALLLTGGATRSAYWCQLRADVLGRSVSLPANAEGALGMAVLSASTGRKPVDVAAEMVRIRDVIDPRPSHLGRFDEPYLRFVDELEHRGWLSTAAAQHAHHRTENRSQS